jgi:hypothetical protein
VTIDGWTAKVVEVAHHAISKVRLRPTQDAGPHDGGALQRITRTCDQRGSPGRYALSGSPERGLSVVAAGAPPGPASGSWFVLASVAFVFAPGHPCRRRAAAKASGRSPTGSTSPASALRRARARAAAADAEASATAATVHGHRRRDPPPR